MHKYSFDIQWSDDDGEYMATCPSFPGLSAFGETEEEALKEAKVALVLFVESYIDLGKSLPKPIVAQEYSGQFRQRLPKSLHKQAATLAAAEGISLNQYITLATQAKVIGDEVATQVEKLSNVAVHFKMMQMQTLTFSNEEYVEEPHYYIQPFTDSKPISNLDGFSELEN